MIGIGTCKNAVRILLVISSATSIQNTFDIPLGESIRFVKTIALLSMLDPSNISARRAMQTLSAFIEFCSTKIFIQKMLSEIIFMMKENIDENVREEQMAPGYVDLSIC